MRAKHFPGLCFDRQQPLRPYIADFYYSAAKLIIELDGSQHGTNENLAYDTARTAWPVERGYSVLRFSDEEFLKQHETVIDTISRFIIETGVPLPPTALGGSPLPQGQDMSEGCSLSRARRSAASSALCSADLNSVLSKILPLGHINLFSIALLSREGQSVTVRNAQMRHLEIFADHQIQAINGGPNMTYKIAPTPTAEPIIGVSVGPKSR